MPAYRKPQRPAAAASLAIFLSSTACTAGAIGFGAQPSPEADMDAEERNVVAVDTVTLTMLVTAHDGEVWLVRHPRIEDNAIKGYEERVDERRVVRTHPVEIDLDRVAETHPIETRIEKRSGPPPEQTTGQKLQGLGAFLGGLAAAFGLVIAEFLSAYGGR